MKIIVAVVVLVVLALLGSRRSLSARRLPRRARVFFTGHSFIVVGLLLGGEFLNLVDDEALSSLRPFVCVVLGWVGFLYGLQMQWRTVKGLPNGFFSASVVQAVVTVAVVLPVAWRLLRATAAVSPETAMTAAITLAGAAACTGQAAMALADQTRPVSYNPILALLRYISSLDPIVGVGVFGGGIALFGVHLGRTFTLPASLQWLAMSVILGVLTAWIFISLTVTRTTQAELVLYLIGTIALASGIALYFGLSVIFVNLVSGIAVANLTSKGTIRARVIELMVGGEKFLYLVLLILAGATFDTPGPVLLFVAAVYVAARAVGKLLGGYGASVMLMTEDGRHRGLGLGLISQAGMALAIVLDYDLITHGAASAVVVTVVVVAILVNELAGAALLLGVARRGTGSPQ